MLCNKLGNTMMLAVTVCQTVHARKQPFTAKCPGARTCACYDPASRPAAGSGSCLQLRPTRPAHCGAATLHAWLSLLQLEAL